MDPKLRIRVSVAFVLCLLQDDVLHENIDVVSDLLDKARPALRLSLSLSLSRARPR
jgi:hypothetical protein